MFKVIIGVCTGAVILSLTNRIVYLEKRIKRMEDALFQFAHKAEYRHQSTNDQIDITAATISTVIDGLYSLGVFDDDDIEHLTSINDKTLLGRFKNRYGEEEGQKRFDIYINNLEDSIDLAFYRKMN